MKRFAFTLSVPGDPAFRPIAAQAAGAYAAALGLPPAESADVAAASRDRIDAAAGQPPADVTLGVHVDGDRLEITVSAGSASSTQSHSLAAAKST